MNNTVGTLVRKFRLEQNQTQPAFAELLGVCERHYRKLEKGQKAFLFEQLMTIAEAFNVDIKLFYPPPFFNKIHSKRSYPLMGVCLKNRLGTCLRHDERINFDTILIHLR